MFSTSGEDSTKGEMGSQVSLGIVRRLMTVTVVAASVIWMAPPLAAGDEQVVECGPVRTAQHFGSVGWTYEHDDNSNILDYAHQGYSHSDVSVNSGQSNPHSSIIGGQGYEHVSGGEQVHQGGECDEDGGEDVGEN